MEDAFGGNPLIQAGSAYVFSYCGIVENNQAESICLGDSLFLDGDYRSISGVYYDTLRASTGCDSVIVMDLKVVEVDTAVTLSGSTLTASTTDANYQWIDCSTQQIIPGETNKNLNPDESGDFAVEITQDGCIATPFCHSITIVGIPKITFSSEFEIYPNPNNGILLVNTGNIYQDLEIRVLNLAGKQILHSKYSNQQSIELRLEKLTAGLYFIQIKTIDKQAVLKVLKQ